MTISNTELRERALAATQGEWEVHDFDPDKEVYVSPVGNKYYRVCGTYMRNEADFIAAANPATILRLLDENEKQREQLKAKDEDRARLAEIGLAQAQKWEAENAALVKEHAILEAQYQRETASAERFVEIIEKQATENARLLKIIEGLRTELKRHAEDCGECTMWISADAAVHAADDAMTESEHK